MVNLWIMPDISVILLINKKCIFLMKASNAKNSINQIIEYYIQTVCTKRILQ